MPATNVTWIVTDQAGSPVPKAKAYLTMEGQSLSIHNGIVFRLAIDSVGIWSHSCSKLEFCMEIGPSDFLHIV